MVANRVKVNGLKFSIPVEFNLYSKHSLGNNNTKSSQQDKGCGG